MKTSYLSRGHAHYWYLSWLKMAECALVSFHAQRLSALTCHGWAWR